MAQDEVLITYKKSDINVPMNIPNVLITLIKESLKEEFYTYSPENITFLNDIGLSCSIPNNKCLVRNPTSLCTECKLASLSMYRYIKSIQKYNNTFGFIKLKTTNERNANLPYIIGNPHFLGFYILDKKYYALDLTSRQDTRNKIICQIFIASTEIILKQIIKKSYNANSVTIVYNNDLNKTKTNYIDMIKNLDKITNNTPIQNVTNNVTNNMTNKVIVI